MVLKHNGRCNWHFYNYPPDEGHFLCRNVESIKTTHLYHKSDFWLSNFHPSNFYNYSKVSLEALVYRSVILEAKKRLAYWC